MLRKPHSAICCAAFFTICGLLVGVLWEHSNKSAGAPEARVSLADGFDGVRAFLDLNHLVSFGPRPAGSKNLEHARQWIVDQLRDEHLTVETDSFVASTPVGSIPMTNIVAKIPGASPSIVIIGGHYDTKRMATLFVGANDGGSSAAFLLEMARVLARRTNKLTYWLVFFDGEEAVQCWSATDGLYGSRHFAQKIATQRLESRVKAVIVVDMIADAHLDIHRESHSTPWLTDIVFTQAQRLGYGRYFLNSSRTIEDDHVPFLKLGIPAADIIDLDYGPFSLYWHTRFDTGDKCSRASLAIVGAVLLKTLYTMESQAVQALARKGAHACQSLPAKHDLGPYRVPAYQEVIEDRCTDAE
jgi:glutaminyl-peptide cyclotransferase